MQLIKFVNFTHLGKSDLIRILEKRNSDEIRSKMVNRAPIPLESHLKFCEHLKKDNSKLYFAIYVDSVLAGVADFQNINYENHTYEPGIYFVNDNSIIRSHITVALLQVRLHYRLYNPVIRVRKDNLQALIFNTMKMGAKVEREDDEFYYLSGSRINVNNEKELGVVYWDLAQLEKKYILQYEN